MNTGRGGLVVEEDVAAACRSGKLYGYGADVVASEPMVAPHPYMGVDSIVLTPHVGSRTNESVERQARLATSNIVQFLSHDRALPDYVRANQVFAAKL